ncbi:MAG: glycine hydroxymethyltransferase [Waddliaceae bacterium]
MSNSRVEKYWEKHPKEVRNPAAIAYLAALDSVESVSPSVAASILKELQDERSHLKLIASENFSSLAVQLAMGNLLTDKYAEGYAGHRFYAGCDNVDAIEEDAQNRLKQLYHADCAYVQPHSGADANLVAYWVILVHNVQNAEIEKLGKKSLNALSPEEYEQIRQLMINQKLMGMSLNAGGHLTHGYLHNVSSKMMKAVVYDVDPKTERINYQTLAEQVKQEKPAILLAGYSSYPRRINFAVMREIADSVGAVFMVDMAHFAGLVAGKVFTGDDDPVPFAHIVTSTTHKTLRGPRGGFILCTKEYGDVVNRGCPLVLGGPLPHVIAAKAVAFKEAQTAAFQDYARQVVANARALAMRIQERGVRIVTEGTDNHLVVLDLGSFGLTGKQGETALRQAGITVNRNAIPFDKNGPWYTSGIRVGTPATTTLGMKEEQMRAIADMIVDVLAHTEPAIAEKTGKSSKANSSTELKTLERVRGLLADLLQQYPLYPEIEGVEAG